MHAAALFCDTVQFNTYTNIFGKSDILDRITTVLLSSAFNIYN